jgi:hypothetical protein
VDYSPFKNQKLIKRDGLTLTGKPKGYGMKKVKLK